MSMKSLRRSGSCLFLIALLALASWPGVAATQDDPAKAAPLNAHMKRYGGGWECDRGYREVNAACAAVEVPANAHLADSSYGRGWECDRGYRRVNETCELVEVPPNAFLRSNGRDWECDRGHQNVDQSCVAIKLPAHAYLVDSSYGRGWECDRGYREIDNACAVVTVPPNAFLNSARLPARATISKSASLSVCETVPLISPFTPSACRSRSI